MGCVQPQAGPGGPPSGPVRSGPLVNSSLFLRVNQTRGPSSAQPTIEGVGMNQL